MNLSPLNRRRFNNFKSNKRGWYSFWIFSILFLISIFANFIANDKPLIVKYNNELYFPIIYEYSETTFGGDFETEADFRDPYVKNLINNYGWMIWPIIPYSYDTIIRGINEECGLNDITWNKQDNYNYKQKTPQAKHVLKTAL